MAHATTRPSPEPRLIHWADPPERPAEALESGQRCALLIAGEVERVTLPGGEPLPWLGASMDRLRRPWHKFELPFIDPVAGDNTASSLRVRIQYADGTRQRWSARVPPGPRESGIAEERALRQLADRRRGLVAELERRQSARGGGGVFRAGRTGEGLAVPLKRLAPLWTEHEAKPPVRHEIVRAWADRLEQAVKEICHAPRTALVRERRVLAANRVQELDAHCLRWLARQPGTSTAEKAGARQRVLGITRTERLATVENRVAAMVIRSLRRECRRVLDETGPSTPANEPVRRLLGVIEHLRRESELLQLEIPGRSIRANHVLRSDPRYRLLWRSHLELRHRAQRREASLRWRHRLWAEHCIAALAARLEQSHPRSPAGRSCLVFRRRAWQGRLIDPTTALGRWEAGTADRPDSLLLIERRDLPRFRDSPLVPEPLIAMSPDALLIRRAAGSGTGPSQDGETTILGVWAQWRPDEADAGAALLRRCETTAHRLEQAGAGTTLRGLLLEPGSTEPRTESDDAELTAVQADPRGRLPHGQAATSGSCRGLKLPLPLTAGWAALERALGEILWDTASNRP